MLKIVNFEDLQNIFKDLWFVHHSKEKLKTIKNALKDCIKVFKDLHSLEVLKRLRYPSTYSIISVFIFDAKHKCPTKMESEILEGQKIVQFPP